jgi:hypothetical protein
LPQKEKKQERCSTTSALALFLILRISAMYIALKK